MKTTSIQLNSNTDTLELYSFVIKLYGFLLYYRFLFNHNILVMIVIKIITVLLFQFLLKKNFFSILNHKYLIYNTFDLAVPQITNSIYNVFILPSNLYISIPLSFVIMNYIERTFPTEPDVSKKLRYYAFISFVCFFALRFLWSWMHFPFCFEGFSLKN